MTPSSSSDEPIGEAILRTYAGKWVAVSRGEVVGAGDTAKSALERGQEMGELPDLHLIFAETPGGTTLNKPEILTRLARLFREHDEPVYLVGGTVRDLLLERESKDLDFAVPNCAIQLAFKTANKLGVPAFVLDQERDIGRVIVREEGLTLDFAGFRGDAIDEDLRGRDFTINALALPSGAETDQSIIDPCQGMNDLRRGIIRMARVNSIANDPVRALRALRFSNQLGFEIDSSTEAAVQAAGSTLATVSNERIRDELSHLIRVDDPAGAMRDLQRVNLLPYILPEVDNLQAVEQSAPHHEEVLDHTLNVLEVLRWLEKVLFEGLEDISPARKILVSRLGGYSNQLRHHLARYVEGDCDGLLVLRLGALLHDIGKPQSQMVEDDGRIRFIGHDEVGASLANYRLRELRFSRKVVDSVSLIVRGHMWPLLLAEQDKVTRRAIYRFFRRSGAVGLDIGLLALADHLAIHQPSGSLDGFERLASVVDGLFDHYFNHFEDTIEPALLISGGYLIDEFGLDPGPQIGRLLDLIQEAQASGEIKTISEARDLVEKQLLVEDDEAKS
ncbi:MAG: HDIG domain-containing metalloprotein [Candidatus Promineifilaceae bacterium]